MVRGKIMFQVQVSWLATTWTRSLDQIVIPNKKVVIGNDLVKCCSRCLEFCYIPLGYCASLVFCCMFVVCTALLARRLCNCCAYVVVSPMEGSCKQPEDTLKHMSKIYSRRIETTTIGGHWIQRRLGKASPKSSQYYRIQYPQIQISPCFLGSCLHTLVSGQ